MLIFFFYVIYSKHKTHSPYAFFFRCFQTCRQFDKVVGFKLKSRLSIFSCGYLKSDVYFLWPNLIARWGQIPTFYQYGARHYGICYVKLYVTPVVEWTLFTLNPHKEVKELVKTYSSIQPWKQSRSYLCCWRCYTEFSIDHMVLISLRLHRWTDKSSSAATPPNAAQTTACINTRYVTDLNAAFKKVAYIKVYLKGGILLFSPNPLRCQKQSWTWLKYNEETETIPTCVHTTHFPCLGSCSHCLLCCHIANVSKVANGSVTFSLTC